jgi:Zn-dependent M28 family amino/carboxypeptidase
MNKLAVASSNVETVAYARSAPGGPAPNSWTIDTTFKGGATYRANNVPESILHGYLTADSKGSFYATYIKDNPAYRIEKVAAE